MVKYVFYVHKITEDSSRSINHPGWFIRIPKGDQFKGQMTNSSFYKSRAALMFVGFAGYDWHWQSNLNKLHLI